jgi:serine/threonine protein kinase
MSETARARSPVAPGEIVGGKYKVERVLGAGGMGVVVAARHVELDQPVALKFILPEAINGTSNVERFMREARATVRLKSEHVARVYDVGRDAKDRPYMVLELLEGTDLAKLNAQRGPLPVADSVEYVIQACEALIEAHGAGIIHRDLKPQNLFVTKRLNGTPLVKVLDFGIAKAVGPTALGQMALTDSATIIGSPLYMAPEQMRAERTIDARTDIWSIGVVLYELLGGELPFTGDTVTAVVIKVVNEPAKALSSLRPGLDENLATIVMRCLEKRPDDRWPNVAQLASALEPFSRSAKQGGLVRPWRSFEDTQDSAVRPPVGAASPVSPDATGPATPVVMGDTLRDAVLDADAAPAKASGTGEKLVSTDVTWGESTTDPPPRPRRSRAFGTGLAAGVVVSLAAAGVAAALLLKTPTPAASSAPGAAATPSAQEPTPSAPEPMPSAVSTPPPPATTELPAETSPAPAVAVSALPAATVHKHVRPARSATPAVAPPLPSTTAHPPDAPPKVTADPVAPNGAPILR